MVSSVPVSKNGWADFVSLFLSDDPRQRLRILRSFIAAFVYAVGWWVGDFAVSHWQVSAAGVRVYQWTSLCAVLAFYLVIRLGWNTRLSDPSLSAPQILVAQTLAALAYVVVPQARGGLLMLQVMVVFFGMFKLRWMGQILLTAYGMTLMAGVMAVMSALRPEVFDPSVELVHFVVLAAVLPSVAVLGAQLTSMRIKLKTQKAELQQALAHNTQLANHDALTGLCNRRYMEECIQRQQKMNQRTGHASTLAMLDLDHFKQINDAHGHRVGDDVLCVFARHLRFALRETDLIARWGGEEFLLMLPNTQPEEAVVVLGRIRDALARLPSPSNQHALQIRFSAGVTALPSYEPLESALDRADRALYRAKDLGRNQSVLI